MQFLTVLKPKFEEYRLSVQPGGRGLYFNNFAYELHDDPTVEIIAVRFGPNLMGSPPHALWPDVEIGAHRGAAEALAISGLRLCCVRFTLTFAKHHDVDATPRAVQLRVADCVYGEVALRQTEPVWPLHTDWLTSDVVALARGIDANGALDGLPALTDALLEAGCDHPLALEHLRTCTDHGSSCWVVEMICAQAAARDAGTSG